MWIFLGIVAFLALLITAILLLPIDIIIKNDDDDNLILLYKILFKTFGENPDPNNILVKTIKETSGISKIEKDGLKKNVAESGFWSTVSYTARILLSLLQEIVNVLKYCKLKKLNIKAVCAGEDAAETAVDYGKCCAIIYPIAGFLSSNMKVKRKAQKIDIKCDYTNGENIFKYDILIMIRMYHAIAALFRIALKEAKRTAEQQNS